MMLNHLLNSENEGGSALRIAHRCKRHAERACNSSRHRSLHRGTIQGPFIWCLCKLAQVSTVQPGIHTGNIDNKDLGANTILYMPIHVRGALFSAGDGHASQGHGEVDQTAIETGLRGRFQFFIRKDMKLRWPRAETPTHWVVMGIHEELEQAMK